MTNEQIMKWAAEAGISDWFLGTEDFQSSLQAKRVEQLKKFAEMAANDAVDVFIRSWVKPT